MKFKLKILREPLFWLFLVMAAALWYINKLAYNYRAEVEIPIVLTSDYGTQGWIENPKMRIKCLVEGKGKQLLRYRSGIESEAYIPMASLTALRVSEDGYMYNITDVSLLDALRISKDGIQFLQLIDTIPWVKMSPMESVTLPIANNIHVDCAKQYMLVGGQAKLQPATINLKIPRSMLDTLKYIRTEEKIFHNKNKSFSGTANLIIPQGVIASDNQIRYSADIESYTEEELLLPLEYVNVPKGKAISCATKEVRVIIKVPINSYSLQGKGITTAKVDCADHYTNRGNLVKVRVENVPQNGTITSIKPEFVEPYFITN